MPSAKRRLSCIFSLMQSAKGHLKNIVDSFKKGV